MNLFKGKLTYGLALIGIVFGIYQLIVGQQEQGINTIYTALAIFGLRRAVA